MVSDLLEWTVTLSVSFQVTRRTPRPEHHHPGEEGVSASSHQPAPTGDSETLPRPSPQQGGSGFTLSTPARREEVARRQDSS